MKWSSFLLGGLAGMASVLYLSRKRPEWIALAGSAAGDMMTAKFMKKKAASVPKSVKASAENSAEAWNHIQSIIKDDSELSEQVEQILKDDGKAH